MTIYEEIKQNLTVQKLIIVTKKRNNDEIMKYYNLNERYFGENRAEELIAKATSLPSDIQWHFIGHLQRNKVKLVLPYLSMIQSVESINLVQVINDEAKKSNRIIPILIQFNFAKEDTKTGLSYTEAIPFIKRCLEYPNIQVKGIMCMGPHTDDTNKIAEVFQEASQCFKELQSYFGKDIISECSMGMSDDYLIACTHGSTMVRIGTSLFI
ncbi:YggS family pyridoxal phosphate-dependent enzyme [Anaerorhabdus sp.]|uniref:YggS family pyridoxal phosphate-dependent enzyme n=1 Tax=Anaerorhabdus sp. TaxID=1872524 RepID=UPI002FC68FC9